MKGRRQNCDSDSPNHTSSYPAMAQHSGLLHNLFKPPKVQGWESLLLSQLDLKGKWIFLRNA